MTANVLFTCSVAEIDVTYNFYDDHTYRYYDRYGIASYLTYHWRYHEGKVEWETPFRGWWRSENEIQEAYSKYLASLIIC